MLNWLYLLLALPAIALCLWVYRSAYNRGYDAGMEDASEFGRYVDEVLRDDLSRP